MSKWGSFTDFLGDAADATWDFTRDVGVGAGMTANSLYHMATGQPDPYYTPKPPDYPDPIFKQSSTQQYEIVLKRTVADPKAQGLVKSFDEFMALPPDERVELFYSSVNFFQPGTAPAIGDGARIYHKVYDQTPTKLFMGGLTGALGSSFGLAGKGLDWTGNQVADGAGWIYDRSPQQAQNYWSWLGDNLYDPMWGATKDATLTTMHGLGTVSSSVMNGLLGANYKLAKYDQITKEQAIAEGLVPANITDIDFRYWKNTKIYNAYAGDGVDGWLIQTLGAPINWLHGRSAWRPSEEELQSEDFSGKFIDSDVAWQLVHAYDTAGDSAEEKQAALMEVFDANTDPVVGQAIKLGADPLNVGTMFLPGIGRVGAGAEALGERMVARGSLRAAEGMAAEDAVLATGRSVLSQEEIAAASRVLETGVAEQTPKGLMTVERAREVEQATLRGGAPGDAWAGQRQREWGYRVQAGGKLLQTPQEVAELPGRAVKGAFKGAGYLAERTPGIRGLVQPADSTTYLDRVNAVSDLAGETLMREELPQGGMTGMEVPPEASVSAADEELLALPAGSIRNPNPAPSSAGLPKVQQPQTIFGLNAELDRASADAAGVTGRIAEAAAGTTNRDEVVRQLTQDVLNEPASRQRIMESTSSGIRMMDGTTMTVEELERTYARDVQIPLVQRQTSNVVASVEQSADTYIRNVMNTLGMPSDLAAHQAWAQEIRATLSGRASAASAASAAAPPPPPPLPVAPRPAPAPVEPTPLPRLYRRGPVGSNEFYVGLDKDVVIRYDAAADEWLVLTKQGGRYKEVIRYGDKDSAARAGAGMTRSAPKPLVTPEPRPAGPDAPVGPWADEVQVGPLGDEVRVGPLPEELAPLPPKITKAARARIRAQAGLEPAGGEAPTAVPVVAPASEPSVRELAPVSGGEVVAEEAPIQNWGGEPTTVRIEGRTGNEPPIVEPRSAQGLRMGVPDEIPERVSRDQRHIYVGVDEEFRVTGTRIYERRGWDPDTGTYRTGSDGKPKWDLRPEVYGKERDALASARRMAQERAERRGAPELRPVYLDMEPVVPLNKQTRAVRSKVNPDRIRRGETTDRTFYTRRGITGPTDPVVRDSWLNPANRVRSVEQNPGNVVNWVSDSLAEVRPDLTQDYWDAYQAHPQTRAYLIRQAEHDLRPKPKGAGYYVQQTGGGRKAALAYDSTEKYLDSVVHEVEVQRPLVREVTGIDAPQHVFTYEYNGGRLRELPDLPPPTDATPMGEQVITSNRVAKTNRLAEYDRMTTEKNYIEQAVFGSEADARGARRYFQEQLAHMRRAMSDPEYAANLGVTQAEAESRFTLYERMVGSRESGIREGWLERLRRQVPASERGVTEANLKYATRDELVAMLNGRLDPAIKAQFERLGYDDARVQELVNADALARDEQIVQEVRDELSVPEAAITPGPKPAGRFQQTTMELSPEAQKLADSTFAGAADPGLAGKTVAARLQELRTESLAEQKEIIALLDAGVTPSEKYVPAPKETQIQVRKPVIDEETGQPKVKAKTGEVVEKNRPVFRTMMTREDRLRFLLDKYGVTPDQVRLIPSDHLATERLAREWVLDWRPTYGTDGTLIGDMAQALVYRLPRRMFLADPISSWAYTGRNVISNVQLSAIAGVRPTPEYLNMVYRGVRSGMDVSQEANIALGVSKSGVAQFGSSPIDAQLDKMGRKGDTRTGKWLDEKLHVRSIPVLGKYIRASEAKRGLDVALEASQKRAFFGIYLRGQVRERVEGLGELLERVSRNRGVTIHRDDISRIADRLMTDNGLFSHQELGEAIYNEAITRGASEEVAQNIAEASARTWRGEARSAINASIEQTNRAFPSMRMTKLDQKVSWVTMFHMWPTRAGRFLLEEMASKPLVARAWIKMHDAVLAEADQRDWPGPVKGLIRLGASPLGMALYANPKALYLFNPFTQNNAFDKPENLSGFGNFLWKLKSGELFPGQPSITLVPLIDAMLNLTGYQGNTFVPDFVNFRDIDLAMAAWDALNTQFLDGHIHDPVMDQWMSSLRAKASGLLPGSHNIPETNQGDATRDKVYGVILDQHPELLTAMSETEPGTVTGESRPTPRAIEAERQFHAIINNVESPEYRAAERTLARNKAFTTTMNGIVPLSLSVRSTARDTVRDTAGEGYDQVNLGQQPTAEQTGGMQAQSVIAAGPGAGGTLKLEGDQYRALGDADQRTLADGWALIAYGEVGANTRLKAGYGDFIDGEWVEWNDLARMSDAERKALADRWVTSQGGADKLASVRTQQKAFKRTSITYGAYTDWKRGVSDYPGGAGAWVRDQRKINPNYDQYLRIREEQGSTGDALLRSALSTDGYLAYQGESTGLYQPTPIDVFSSRDRPVSLLEETSGGTSSGGYDPAAELQRQVDEYLAADDEIRRRFGIGWEEMAPVVQQSLEPRLRDAGVDIPYVGQDLQDYFRWVAAQPASGDVSVSAYVTWLEAQRIAS